MGEFRQPVLIRSHVTVGGRTAVALSFLVIAGAVLFGANMDGPRDFTGYPFLLVPLIGTALLTRGSFGSGLAAAVLSLGLGYFLGAAIAVIAALAALT